MNGCLAWCRQGLLRAAVLAVFAWVLAFSALFHYHLDATGTATTLSGATLEGSALEAHLTATQRLGAASPAETDCLICALGGVQTGAPGLPAGVAAQPGGAMSVPPAASAFPASRVAATLPRAPPAPLV